MTHHLQRIFWDYGFTHPSWFALIVERIARRRFETWPLPHAEFRMTNGEVEIVITGAPAEVHRVVSMLDQALMA